MAYAENTTVSVEKSVGEIVTLVKKAGAYRIGQVEDVDTLALQFFLNDRLLRFRVDMPTLEQMPSRNARGTVIPTEQRNRMAAQACRQKARALLLVIKAKLESVESKVETFDEAFLPNIVTPEGLTIAEIALPQIANGYSGGKQPALMLGFAG